MMMTTTTNKIKQKPFNATTMEIYMMNLPLFLRKYMAQVSESLFQALTLVYVVLRSYISTTYHTISYHIFFFFIIITIITIHSFAYIHKMWNTVTDYSIFFWFRGYCCCCCLFSYSELPPRLLFVVVSRDYRWRKKQIFFYFAPATVIYIHVSAIFRFML